LSALPQQADAGADRRVGGPAFLQDPYPAYAAMREAGPIHWSDDFFDGAWVLARHADVDAVLRDDTRFSARRTGGWVGQGEQQRGELRVFQALFARAMLFVDGQDHTRLRQLLNAGFRPSALQALAPRIEARVRERLDAVDAAAGFDFMQAVAGPLPAEVIAMLMGIGEPDHERFAAWTEGLAAFIGALRPTPELGRRAQRCLVEMSEFFAALLRQRRGAPGEGLVGRLLQGEAEGRVQGGAELLAQCAMLLFAGHETTRNLLGNGLLALLQHRDQWQLLQREPERVGDAVRELLRYDSPVQYTGRRVAQDMLLHGVRLRRGDLVVALIGAANRDPLRYEDPDRLDVTRRPGGLLSFGRGAHVCIGAALTQMEGEAVLRQVLRRWPGLRLADRAPRWNGNPVYRGVLALPVRAGGQASCWRI
jgi:hypothetical protein